MAKKHTLEAELELSVNGQDPEAFSEIEIETSRQTRKSILERLREEQPYMEDVGASEAKTSVSMRRPSPLDWFRVHPDTAYRIEAFLISPKRSKRAYVVFGEGLQHLLRQRKQGRDVTIYTCIDRYGEVFLWEISLSQNDWSISARRAALRAQDVWVRLVSNQTLQRYQHEESTKIAAPIWPERAFDAMIEEVFEEYTIERFDHEVIQDLLGEA
jgi:hypothetical protein